jgi:hypothetical protein
MAEQQHDKTKPVVADPYPAHRNRSSEQQAHILSLRTTTFSTW